MIHQRGGRINSLHFLLSDCRDNALLRPEELEAEIWPDVALGKIKEEDASTRA